MASKNVIKPFRVVGRGASSTREYTYEKLAELGVALKLMEYSIGTDIISFILEQWRQEREEVGGIIHLLEYIVYIPKSLHNGKPDKDQVMLLDQLTLDELFEQVKQVNGGATYLVINIAEVFRTVDQVVQHNSRTA